MAIEKLYKCMAIFRGLCKVLTQKFLYLQIGKCLRIGICCVASLGHCPHTVQVWCETVWVLVSVVMMSVVMALITVVLAVLVFTCSDWSGNVLICSHIPIPSSNYCNQ